MTKRRKQTSCTRTNKQIKCIEGILWGILDVRRHRRKLSQVMLYSGHIGTILYQENAFPKPPRTQGHCIDLLF